MYPENVVRFESTQIANKPIARVQTARVKTCDEADMMTNGSMPAPDPARPGRKRSATGLLNAAHDEIADGVTRLRAIIDKLIAEALEGNVAAIREVFDRRDGRSPSALRNIGGPRKVRLRWMSEDEARKTKQSGMDT